MGILWSITFSFKKNFPFLEPPEAQGAPELGKTCIPAVQIHQLWVLSLTSSDHFGSCWSMHGSMGAWHGSSLQTGTGLLGCPNPGWKAQPSSPACSSTSGCAVFTLCAASAAGEAGIWARTSPQRSSLPCSSSSSPQPPPAAPFPLLLLLL